MADVQDEPLKSLGITVRSLRKELAEWTRLLDDTGDRVPGKNPAAVGENSRKSIADWIAFLVVSFSLRSRWANLGVRGQGDGA
jgi:hypothetical protein